MSSPHNPSKYTGINQFLVTLVVRKRRPTLADFKQPETGKNYILGCTWQVGANPINGVEGELWDLSKIVANQGYWYMRSNGTSGPLITLADTNNTLVSPTAAGTIKLEGTAGEIDIVSDPANNKLVFSIPGNLGKVNSLGVQSTSGAGTNPVLPDANGKIEMQGALVAAGTNPLRAVSTAANTLQYQLQTSQALAAADSTKVGASNFSSKDFIVSSTGFVQAISWSNAKNLGFTYASGTGTFTVHGQDGTALSATNPAFVTVQSKLVPGNLVTVMITANQSFIDDNGASEIIGNLFGLTTSIAHANAMPFFLYGVLNDLETAIAFMISRFPNATVSPINTKIGKSGSAVASTQGSFFSLANVTVTDYDQNPCLSLGSFRMVMSNLNDWTVQTLDNGDGIGLYQEDRLFATSNSQFGAATGSYYKANGGTAPIFSAQALTYFVNRTGTINFQTAFTTATTPGAGAVTSLLAMPFLCNGGSAVGTGFLSNTTNDFTISGNIEPINSNQLIFRLTALTASSIVTNATYAANSSVACCATYKPLFS